MEIVIDFSGGARVDAHVGQFTVRTDQPPQAGGEDTAPSPFTTFLATVGACAGYYVLSFCRQRSISTDGMRLIQHLEFDPVTQLASEVFLDIQLPPGFPEKYRAAVIRAAEQCKVKKQLEHPPTFEISAEIVERVTA